MHRITITGDPGSGKTTFARAVSSHTGHRLITTGTIFRRFAAERGITVTEVNELAETQAEIDRMIDDYLVALNETDEPLVLDSRMAWHFVRPSLKIRLTVDPEIAARRIFGDRAELRETFANMAQAVDEVERRRRSEVARYMASYGVDIADPANFDLVIDTTGKTAEEVMEWFGRFRPATALHSRR